MKAIIVAAFLTLASCGGNTPAYAGPTTPPAKDSVDATGIDISFPMDLSQFSPEQKQKIVAEYCNQGCMVVPNEVLDQIEAGQRQAGALLQKQQAELVHLRADKDADEKIIEHLKDELKAST